MPGVEIIEKVPVYEMTIVPMVVLMVLYVIAAMVVSWVSFKKNSNKIAVVGGTIVVLALFIGMSVADKFMITDTIDYYQYRVTISDEVGFKAFDEKYEVVGQDGDIYTVVEKGA